MVHQKISMLVLAGLCGLSIQSSLWAGADDVFFEGEKMKVLHSSGRVTPQDLRPYGDGAWSNNAHLWWTNGKPGETLELALPVAAAGKYRLACGLTKAVDYGIFEVALDGKKLLGPLDCFNDGVIHTGTMALGEAIDLTAGEHRLTFTVVGANKNALPGNMLGLDYVWLAGANADIAALGPKLGRAKPPIARGKQPKAEMKEGNAMDAQPKSPAEERAAFTLPEGFTIELVASEETGLPKPVMTVFDSAGRMWSVTATEYPRDQDPGIWKQPGKDRVVIFDTPCASGPQTPRTFADGLVMPLSVLPYGKGAFVAQGPEIVYWDDQDGDGKAEHRKVLLSGFGVQDTHTLPHQLTLLPGGRIVYSQGVLNHGKVTDAAGRTIDFNKTQVATFRPDGTAHEVIGAGLNNIWCWSMSQEGRVFIHEANDFGYSLVPFEEDSTYPSFIATKLHPAAPLHPPTAQGLDLGGTGFSGLALCDDRAGSFPAPWHGVMFVSNPILGRIQGVSMTQGENGVYAFKKAGDLVKCSDPMFRPVAITFGPDGCLYITDWYNRIISHNEVARDHAGRDKSRGRIWRVRHQSQAIRQIPNIAKLPNAELPVRLAADSTWEMRSAWQEIASRKAVELAPELMRVIRDSKTADDVRIHALWSLEDLGKFDAKLWQELLASPNANVRREAVRALSFLKVPAQEGFALVQPLAGEPSWTVRYEMMRYFRRAGASAEQLAWLHRWSEGPADQTKVDGWNGPFLALGGAYERAFLDFLWMRISDKSNGGPAVDPRWDAVLETKPARSAAETDAVNQRIAAVTKAIANAGNRSLESGAAIVKSTCLQCHRIGNEGVSLAPPLDGSANRDTAALITAIVDPDAAVENVFRLYQVETNDGQKLTGFRKNVDTKELTLMSMGGGLQVVPLASIKKAGYIQGQSVMPALGSGLEVDQVTDIVRYLKTVR